MALKCRTTSFNWNFDGTVASVSIGIELYDDALLDADENPKILWAKTIIERQNVGAIDPRDALVAKLVSSVNYAIGRAVTNAVKIKDIFGTYDPDVIGASLRTSVETAGANKILEITG